MIVAKIDMDAMPKACYMCKCSHLIKTYYGNYAKDSTGQYILECCLIDGHYVSDNVNGRDKDCPLVEIKDDRD